MSIEILGIIASLLVLASFFMNGESKIRIVNIFGALAFVIYGLLLGAFSVWFLNGALFIVHIVKLYRLRSRK